MNGAILFWLLALSSIAAVVAQAATGARPRTAPAATRPANSPPAAANGRRHLELRFPRALEPLRGTVPAPRSEQPPSTGRPPGDTPVARPPGYPGRLRMARDRERHPAFNRMPAVAVPQDSGWKGPAGHAARLARPLAGVGLLAFALAAAWRAWRRRGRVG